MYLKQAFALEPYGRLVTQIGRLGLDGKSDIPEVGQCLLLF